MMLRGSVVDRHRSARSSSPKHDLRSFSLQHGSPPMPSNTTTKAFHAAGYKKNVMEDTASIQARQLEGVNSLHDHRRYHYQDYSNNGMAAYYSTPNTNLAPKASVPGHHHDHGYDDALSGLVAPQAYVCHPCDHGSGFGNGIQIDDYNLSFPPIVQAVVDGSHHGSGRIRSNSNNNNRRDERPLVAAGDGGERPSQNHQPPSGHATPVTPQNLRDNPERLAKVKTEMCHFVDENGGFTRCPFGVNCNYAHGKEELKNRYTTLRLMEKAGRIVNANTYLARPCMTWVMTGACPYGRRCAAMHDPFIAAPLEFPSWLPIATAKTNTKVIIDGHAAHRDSAVHQENPLIDQSIWENCRPSQRGVATDAVHQGVVSLDWEHVWSDTYSLVCNDCKSICREEKHVQKQGKEECVENEVTEELNSLQKLCIVRLMHIDPMIQENHYRDFIFAPTHSLHGELCMVLQTRYFFLPNVTFSSADDICRDDVVKEVSLDRYNQLTGKKLIAHEVAFAPKGDHFANVSIWFGDEIVSLEQSQIKRNRRVKQKKKELIRNSHGITRPNADGALISITSSVDFHQGIGCIEPFVSMSPADNSDECHGLIMSIIEHRIDTIIVEYCSSVSEEQKKRLDACKRQLLMKFISMLKFHEKWMWPKREGMGKVTISTKAPPGNIMPYIPLKSNKTSACVPVWNSFVKNIGGMDAHDEEGSNDPKRLAIFSTLGSGTPLTNESSPLPRILSNASTPAGECETWNEIVLGVPGNGKWETALRIHNKKREEESPINITVNARNTPLSTVPFLQV